MPVLFPDRAVSRQRCAMVVLLFVSGSNVFAQVESESQLKNIAEGYRANREAFAFFTCQFAARFGEAASQEEAREKGVTRVREAAEGTWIVDEAKCLFEIRRSEDSQVISAVGDPGGFGVGLCPTSILDNGAIAVKYDLLLGAGGVLPREVGVLRPEDTPWDCIPYTLSSDGRGHPAGVVENWRMGGDPVEFEGERILDGVKLASLVVKFPGGYRMRMLVDPVRGYLPIQSTISRISADGEETISTVGQITHVRECSHSRWFPERCVITWLDAPSTVTVKELRVTGLEVDAQPAENAFRLTIPGGIRLHDGLQLGQQFVIPEETSVRADELGRLLQSVRDAQREPFSKGVGVGRIAGIISGVILLVVLILIAARRWKKDGRDVASNAS